MSSINTILQGLQAASELQSVSAQNIANINTDGYKKLEATVTEGENGDVIVDIGTSDLPGPTYQVLGVGEVEASNVNLIDETVDQISAQRMFEANLAALETEDEMLKSTIDILA